MKQPKVKFLTVVWGERYIERFCSLSVPSFIAPGNLPSLVVGTELEVVIMTREADRRYFERNLSFLRLCDICRVRFLPIDDLITTGVHGVTLTLAYARPIIASGDDMLNTHFVFMNADFVLADGSLRSLGRHIKDGRSIVLGPSYRAIAEEVETALDTLVDRDSGVLEVAPRELVRLSLPHPHRTTVAKTMNQQVFCSTHPNQLFWQVDRNTLLGRYFLIFMLCIKPERVISNVNCYCDYSFIPELCPSGDEVAMGDSDQFFMLEMQNRTQETFMLRQGMLPYRKIAASLQEWATAEHRRVADYDIIFHSDEIPARLADAKREADLAVGSIRKFLGKPKSHVNHHYWVMGVEAWKAYRQQQGLSYEPPELAPYRLGLREHYLLGKDRLSRYLRRSARAIAILPSMRKLGRTLRRIERLVMNEPGRSSTASTYWQMTQLLTKLMLELLRKDAPMLLIGHPSDRSAIVELPMGVLTTQESGLSALLLDGQRYNQVVFFPQTLRPEYLETYLGLLLASLNPGGTLHIVTYISARREDYLKAVDLVFQVGEVVGNRMKSLSVRTIGGRLLTVGDRLKNYPYRHLLKYGRRHRLLMAPLLAPVTMVGMLLTHFANTLIFSDFGRRLTARTYGSVISIDIADEKLSAE